MPWLIDHIRFYRADRHDQTLPYFLLKMLSLLFLLCFYPASSTLCVTRAHLAKRSVCLCARERPGSIKSDGEHQTGLWTLVHPFHPIDSSSPVRALRFVSNGFMLKLLLKHTHFCASFVRFSLQQTEIHGFMSSEHQSLMLKINETLQNLEWKAQTMQNPINAFIWQSYWSDRSETLFQSLNYTVKSQPIRTLK